MSRFQSSHNMLPPIQNVDIINPTNEILTKNQEGNTLIWYDTSLSLTNNDTATTKRALRSVNDYILLFDDEEKCIHYIESIDTDNIFMVISGASSTTLLPQIHGVKQVKAICIFCMNGEVYKSLLNEYGKVIGICIEQEELVTCLNKAIYSSLQKSSLMSSMKNKTKQETHLSAMDAYDFKKQQLIKDIILRMPRTEQSKQKLIDYCRFYYQGNEKLLKDLDEFDECYDSPCQAIALYTRDSLWYRIINHAFRIQDPELLERFQFFITDLSEALKHGFEKLKTSLSVSKEKILTLYRTHNFSTEEYSRFPACGFVTFNSYLSTSSNIEVAKLYGSYKDNQISPDPNFVPVLFQIELDLASLNNHSVILADINEASQFPEECEYLFDFGATFEIINDNNRTIKMVISDKPHHFSSAQLHDAYLYKYASKDIISLIGDNSPLVNFSESLLQIDESFIRLDAFEDYILKTPIHDENYEMASRYCIDGHTLPRVDPNSLYAEECRKNNPDNPYTDECVDAYKQAIKYFQTFYDHASDELIQWALRALGYTHYKIDKYPEAQTYFIKALTMNNDPLNLTTCYYFLGCINGELSNYIESMNYFDKILQMKDSIKLSFIAATYYQMAMFQRKNEASEYLSQKAMKKQYLSCALNIYQQINEQLFILKCRSVLLNLENWPSRDDCIDILDGYYKYCQEHQIDLKPIIQLYEQIGYNYFEDLEYDQALKCYMKAVLYFPNSFPCHRVIVEIYIRNKDSKSTIEYLEKTLQIAEDSKKIVSCHLLMGLEYFKQNNFDRALQCLTESVSVCNNSDSDTQFTDYILDFEIERKTQIATCRSLINPDCPTTKSLYFCTKALTFSLDLVKLFKSEIIFIFETIDLIRNSNYTEQIKCMVEENDNKNEIHLENFILETIFDNYIIMGDDHDANALFYYATALKIYYENKKSLINRDIESVCRKINDILKSNYSYNQLVDRIHKLLYMKDSQKEILDELNLFKRNYLIELKENQLAKLYSHIGDIYSKTENYEEAKLYYDKSIKYYETFSLLFHLEIADLYSKKGSIIHTQHKQPEVNNDSMVSYTKAQELFAKSVVTIKNAEAV